MLINKLSEPFQGDRQEFTIGADSAFEPRETEVDRQHSKTPSKGSKGRFRASQWWRLRSAIWKPARLPRIPVASSLDWVRFFAEVGTDFEFLKALFCYLKKKKAERSGRACRACYLGGLFSFR